TEGYLPEAMVNFLALIGWNPGTNREIFSMEELTDAFTLDKIQKSGGAFNEEKLQWMNKEYLQKLDTTTFAKMVISALPEVVTQMPLYTEDRAIKLSPTIQERVHTATETTSCAEAGEYNFAFSTPDVPSELLKWKKDETAKDALPRLRKVVNLLTKADFSSPDTIKEAVWEYAEEVGRGELLWPLRVSLTGMERSPDPFTVAYIIDKEQTLIRIQNAITTLDAT
ncbi:MAG: glutamyl/glutaminyl-tRNA synthetase, partial [Acidimicrobiales bacterium]